MALSMAQRRQALLDVFDKHEAMVVLLSCLARSPELWDEHDPETCELMSELVDNGLLRNDGNYFTTTDVGRAALIAYVNGDEDEAEEDDADEEIVNINID